MKLYRIFKQYIWLLNTIYKAKRITLREINEKWQKTEMSGGMSIARTTFNRHRDDILDIFGVYIECDPKDGFRYYIGNAHVLEEDSIQNWMFSTLTVNNTISEYRSLHDCIVLESIPTEGEILSVIVEALKESQVLQITYKKYSSSDEKTYTVNPYCVKLFHRRWYLLCKRIEDGEFRTLSFDRMQNVTPTNTHFEKDEDFNTELYFRNCFGIVNNDGTPTERILVRAYETERLSMRDLPIHSSQKEIFTSNEYSDFELTLRPTLDFAGYLVSRAGLVKVLEPQSLQDKVRELHQNGLNRYE
jgi:hypothetical protein